MTLFYILQFFGSKLYWFIFSATLSFSVRVFIFFPLTCLICVVLYYLLFLLFPCLYYLILIGSPPCSYCYWRGYVVTGCTLWVMFPLLRLSMTTYTLSSQKDFVFSVSPLSNRFLIIVDQLFSILLLIPFCCHTLLCLYASCWINLLVLTKHLKLTVCLSGGLAARKFKYRVNSQSGLLTKQKKIWCIAGDGVLGTIVCVD